MSADFNDGKEPDALRTIGEVSEGLGIKPHVLRYWEQQFPMLSPLKRSGGRRYYRPGDISVVTAINTLVNIEGYTLKGAKAALKSADRRQADRRKGDRREDAKDGSISVAEALPELKALRTRLEAILEA